MAFLIFSYSTVLNAVSLDEKLYVESKISGVQDKTFISYKAIRDDFKKRFNDSYPEDYCGAFQDENGDLNVILTSDNTKAIENIANNGNIKYHKGTYSLNYLEKVMKDIGKIVTDYDIPMVALNEQYNKIDVYLYDMGEEKISGIRNIIKSPAIEFKKQDGKIQFSTINLTNGTRYRIGTQIGTIGFAAINNTTGACGWVIPGHTGYIGAGVYVDNGYKLGTQKSRVLGGKVDASFVERYVGPYEQTYNPTRTFIGGATFDFGADSSYYLIGRYITAYGSVSGVQSGKILLNNATYTAQDPNSGQWISISDGVVANYRSALGGSGAGIIYDSGGPVQSRIRVLMGSHSANTTYNGTNYGIFTKLPNTLPALNIRLW